ncbi:hypothetical protein CULCOIPH002_07490 [Corynebacterium ulcerans]|uniref:Uncharacterized protein n=1 Tax=Corynebacterium ulcerans TaxID=65058 RepID=A0ABD0BEQ8_CORUL|nr:hypothetical protein CULCOIPH001_03600 [Corynebacterium ulcerans]GJJ35837.1 hypothetical protein CULCOIPH002_07490 [Corynebacterium ulcerans]GJJ38973.1 hypothetical protein CULCOIPH003_16040 [Corynebacterium ulcerans]GJJ39881.1 hypothetical protein CULCOIPH004_02920 [Corynebacterium ulcerans]GJJ42307.1 hypothetical protein CULCOIPH005_04960 [Corynebacterium ulcerans]
MHNIGPKGSQQLPNPYGDPDGQGIDQRHHHGRHAMDGRAAVRTYFFLTIPCTRRDHHGLMSASLSVFQDAQH